MVSLLFALVDRDGAQIFIHYKILNCKVYVKAQYLNEKMPVIDSSSKTIRSRAEQGLWEVVYKRTQVNFELIGLV